MTTPQPQQPPFVGTPPQSLTQVLEMWEPFAHQALETQSAVFKSVVEGLPEPLKTQILQMHEAQRQMWDALFAMLRQVASGGQHLTPTAMPAMPVMTAMPGLDFWQKMAAPMFEAQAALMRQSANLVSGSATTQKGDARRDK